MQRLQITKFNKGLVNLDWEITCSVEQIIKLGLLGYLDNISELRLRQYLVLRKIKFLGGLVDYKLEKHQLRYKGQAEEVELQIPAGITELDWCFTRSDVEKLCLHGEKTVSLFNLVQSCKVLKEVLIDVDFSDGVNDLRGCFRGALSLQRVTFSKVTSRAKIRGMFSESGIKEIRLSDYVLNVEDEAWGCFYSCEKLVDLDCSEVTFNKEVYKLVGNNPKLKTISFRDCWFGGKVKLIRGRFLHSVTVDLRGARCKGIEKVKSLSKERESNKAVDEFIQQFELDNVRLIVD